MKKQIFIFTYFVALFACNQAQSEIEQVDKTVVVKEEKNDSLDVKSEVNSPEKKVFFSHKVKKTAGGKDARALSNNEVEISVYIGDVLIDSYQDFGGVDYDENKTNLFVYSDIAEKNYMLKVFSESQIEVTSVIYFEGEERENWRKTYTLDSNGKWKRTKCQGNC